MHHPLWLQRCLVFKLNYLFNFKMFFIKKKEEKDNKFKEYLIPTLDSLFNTALKLTEHREDAEDLVQETSLRAYRFFHRFKEGTNFKAWILKILNNLFINNYRKKKKEGLHRDLDYFLDNISMKTLRNINEEIIAERLKEAVERLPYELKTTLSLFYLEGFSYKDIAEIMEVPLGTVMSRLYTARKLLKKELGVKERNCTERKNKL